MRWLKKDMWKAGIALAGLLLFLVLMMWVSVSAAGAHQGTSGLATPVTGMVQATPTIDPTIVAATAKEQLRKLERDNDRSFQAWFWNTSATLGTIVAAFVAVTGVFATVWFNFRQYLGNQRAAQDKDLGDRAEERLKTAVTALGDKEDGTRVGGAILLRSFLNEGDKEIYKRYYTQIFDLAVAYLRLRRPSDSPEEPDALSQALITVFQEAFPRARDELKKRPEELFNPQSLDARRIQLDKAFLLEADLKQVFMPWASLREAGLTRANLKGAQLWHAKLGGAYLQKADLREADLGGADLSGADLSGAKLHEAILGADLSGANLRKADLSGADLSGEQYGADLRGADLREVTYNTVQVQKKDEKMQPVTDQQGNPVMLEPTQWHRAKYNTVQVQKKDEKMQPVTDQQGNPVMLEPTQWPSEEFDAKKMSELGLKCDNS